MEEISTLLTKKFVDLTMEETEHLTIKLKIFFTDKDRYIVEYLGTENDLMVLIVWLIQNIKKNFKKLKKRSSRHYSKTWNYSFNKTRQKTSRMT